MLLQLSFFIAAFALALSLLRYKPVRYGGYLLLSILTLFQLLIIETKQRFALYIDVEELYLTAELDGLTLALGVTVAGCFLSLCAAIAAVYVTLNTIRALLAQRLPVIANERRFRGCVAIGLVFISFYSANDIYRTGYVTVRNLVDNLLLVDDFSQVYPSNEGKVNTLLQAFSYSKFGDEYSIIAHGGGGLVSQTPTEQASYTRYTNSLAALEQSIADGKRLIELDFLSTSDGELIAGHDWPRVKALLNYQGKNERHQHDNSALSFTEFSQLRQQSVIKPLDIAQLNQLFKLNPELILVTDKTRDFPKLVQGFDFPRRLIVECFSLYQCQRAKRYGIINTALNINLNNNDIVKYLHRNEIAMVTFRGVSEADTPQFELAKALFSSGIISLVYTSEDNLDYLKQHIGLTASAIYSDYFSLTTQRLITAQQ